MKILDFSLGGPPLTCDSTLITCDNTIITCDMTIIPGEVKILIIPREIISTVYVSLYNELTFEERNFSAAATDERGYLTFTVPMTGIKEGDSFELTVRKDAFDGELIYRDKAYATTVKELENYKLNYPDSNGVIIVN